MNIKEFRKKYPEYDSVSDNKLSESLHKKYYSTVDYDTFRDKFIGKPALPSLDFSGTSLGQNAVDMPMPNKWLTADDFKPTFAQELLKPENVFGNVFGTVGSLIPIPGAKESAASLGGEIGQGIEEFGKARLPGAGEYDQEAVKGRIRDAGVRQGALEATSVPFGRAVGMVAKPVGGVISRPFRKAGTKVVKDVITKGGREYAEKVIPAGAIRRAGSWISGKFIPEVAEDAAKMQQNLISAGKKVLPINESEKVTLLPGDVMKNAAGSKVEGLASKGIGGGGIRKQVIERNVPAYNKATEDLVKEVGGINTKLLNKTEIGEDIYKVTKDRYEKVLDPKIKELYNNAQLVISKAGKTDTPALDITNIIEKNIEKVKEGKLFGGLGAKGMGDDIAKKISSVMPSEKASKGAQEVAEFISKQEPKISSAMGSTSKSDLIKWAKQSPDAMKNLIKQGIVEEKDLVPQITNDVLGELGVDTRKITFGQYEKIRQRLVQEFDDVSNALTGDKKVLKKMAQDTYDELDAVFEKAAKDNGIPEAVDKIKYARKFFSEVQDLKNAPVIRNAWQLIENQNQPETILDMLATKDGLRTLQDAKRMIGKEAGGMMSKIRKSIFNGIINDPANQLEDLRLGIKTLNPEMAEKAFAKRFSKEMQKELFPADELAKIKLHFKLGAAVGAKKFIDQSSLGGAGMVVPLVQFGSSGLGGVASGVVAGNVAGIGVGSAILLSPKAISYLSTGIRGRRIVNAIIELNNPKLSSASRSVLLNKFMLMIKSQPSLAAQVRIINTAANTQENTKIQPLQKAGNQ